MFCPNCGSEENQKTQYCRSCGSDLDAVRTAVDKRAGAGSAMLAKSEIGRTLTQKIEAAQSPKDLKKIAEEVLPKLEKFLETPEEKKLRRIRSGSLVALIGLGVAVGFLIVAVFDDPEIIKVAAAGLVTLCIGVAIMINGYFLTVPGDAPQMAPKSPLEDKPELQKNTNDLLMPPTAQSHFSSVTEHTTRTLDDKVPVAKNTGES